MSNQITPNPSVPTQVVAEVKFPRWINNLGIIPTSYKDSMSYYECLAWLCKFLEETVIPSVNENGEAVEELQNLYVELNSYVTHYFETLDVQEEINNKLDAMVEDGTLPNMLEFLIEPFIGNYILVDNYDTVEEAFEAGNRPYGIIYFSPDKEYTINSSIELNHNVSILGNGAKIISNVNNDYVIKYQNPVAPNNWDLFEPYKITDLYFDCNNVSAGAILIDRLHYADVNNIKVENNNEYAFKIKTTYWSKFSNIHVQNCYGGLFNICGTFSTVRNLWLGSNQNLFTNCSIIDFNKSGNYYGIKLVNRSNQNRFTQITIQNSKDNNDNLGIGLYMSNVVNNDFDSFYAESNRIHIYMEKEQGVDTFGNASFYNPYLGTDIGVQCLAYIKDNVANFYNPTFYANSLTDGLNKSLFISHHSNGSISFVHIELDMPYNIKSGNTLLSYYDGTTYTNYEGSNPLLGAYGTVFSKQPYNGNTFNIIHRSAVNPLYVDSMKITSESDVLKVYRYGMFGNKNGTYPFQLCLSGNFSEVPSNPVNGLSFFETVNKKLMTYYNGKWYYADGTEVTIS